MNLSFIQTFEFSNNEVRTIVSPTGEIYFVAADVCRALELTNVGQAVARLSEDEKTIIILNEHGRDYEKTIITESGFYSLVLSSRKPEAKIFKKWVTSEVLPALRKTGKYAIAENEDDTATSQEEADAKLDYELAAANNLLALIDKSIDNKLRDFRRVDLHHLEYQLKNAFQTSITELKELVLFSMQQMGISETLKKKPPMSYVYLMRKNIHATAYSSLHYCKIGKSNDPEKRLNDLELGGSDLEIIEKIGFEQESQALAWEQILHLTFKGCAMKREWYVLEEKHIEFFKKLSGSIEALLF